MIIAIELFPNLSYSNTYDWILIDSFPLPYGFNMNDTPLLIVWQGISGDIFHCKPDNYYVDREIKLRNGKTPPHIFKDHSFNDLWPRYARVSWHIDNWEPSPNVISGHNILSILEGLYTFFTEIL